MLINKQSTDQWLSGGLNPGPQAQEPEALTTKPPSRHWYILLLLVLLVVWMQEGGVLDQCNNGSDYERPDSTKTWPWQSVSN